MLLDLEGHGREEELVGGADLSRTVGWFTSSHPVRVDVTGVRLDAGGQALIERVIGTTGQFMWVEQESHLDAVTALSGSGPAYVFFFLEAMTRAGQDMGLSEAQAYQMAVATFQGASELAARSDEPAAVLRERVTSKGGTTFAAITHMQDTQVAAHFVQAMRKAEARAQELAAEFGR